MRLSRFNVLVEDHPAPGETLFYNTFTGAFVVVDAAMRATLAKIDAGAPLDAREETRFAARAALYTDPDVGIVVTSREHEDRAFDAWFDGFRRAADKLSIIVSTTLACNLDCSYCCQADVLDGRTITIETAAQTAAWIAARAQEIGARAVELAFVGGEPLLHPQRIESIASEVRRRLPEGATLTFHLITNGVFLTTDLVTRLLPLGLVSAQVTLDGDETTHATTRRSKKRGEDSFATIFANVIAAAPRIRMVVNGNFQRDTIHGFVPLLTTLREAGLPPGSRVQFSPALAGLGAPGESGSGSCTWSGSSPELMVGLTDAILQAGFDPGVRRRLYTVGPCAFHQDQSFAIDPDGHIYKCPGFLGKAEWAIGHVATGLTDRYRRLSESRAEKDACGTCAHRPSCSGGCIAAEWVKTGREEGVNCEIGFFESQKEPLVTRLHALATSASVGDALAKFPVTQTSPKTVSQRAGARVALRVLAG